MRMFRGVTYAMKYVNQYMKNQIEDIFHSIKVLTGIKNNTR